LKSAARIFYGLDGRPGTLFYLPGAPVPELDAQNRPALALEVAVLRGDCPKQLAPLARRLEELQCPDGSWPAAPILRVTDPRSEEFGDEYFRSSPIVLDDRRIFTTATALEALNVAEQLLTAMPAR
jgi:hypothetical protein